MVVYSTFIYNFDFLILFRFGVSHSATVTLKLDPSSYASSSCTVPFPNVVVPIIVAPVVLLEQPIIKEPQPISYGTAWVSYANEPAPSAPPKAEEIIEGLSAMSRDLKRKAVKE